MKSNRILLTLFYALLGSVIAGLFISSTWIFVVGGAILGQVLSYVNFGAGILAINLPSTIKEAREQRAKLESDLLSWSERVKNGEEMKDEDWGKWDEMLADSKKLREHVERLEKLEEMQKAKALEIEQTQETQRKDDEKVDVNKAFNKCLRWGFKALTPKEQEFMAKLNTSLPEELRALAAGTDASGGYTVPEGFSNQLEIAMAAYNSVLDACTIITTNSGADLPWPTVNDTSNEGEQLDENTETAADTDPTFGVVTFGAYTYSSKLVPVSVQLVQDSAFDIESLLAQLLGERLGRALATKFTSGTGSSQPNGIVTASTDSAVTPAVASITRTNIVDVMYTVDSAYRARGAFMIADATEKAIRKLSFGTSDDRPLWQASIKDGAPDTIEGKPYFVNNKMSGPGASATSLLFGDLKKYVVRRVKGITLVPFREKYMHKLQVAFLAYCRYDADLVDAGTHPIKKLVHPAS